MISSGIVEFLAIRRPEIRKGWAMIHASLIVVPVRIRIVRLVLCSLCVFGSWNAVEAAILHIVYAVDSRADNVGQDVTAFELQTVLLNNIPGTMYRSYNVPIDRMSEPVILDVLRKVPVGPDDTLMFVYVGHGAWRQDIGTYMTPSASVGQELSATKIVQEVSTLRPRLGIVIFDCCNKEKAPPYNKFVGGVRSVSRISPLFEELFFGSQGYVLTVSSSPGEYAFVRANRPGQGFENEPPRGPLFLSAFAKTLEVNKEQRLDWKQVTARTQTQLDRYLDFMKNQYPQGIITLNDGTQVNQQRQTIQLRFFR